MLGLVFLQVVSDTLGRQALLEGLCPGLAAGFLGGFYRRPRRFDQAQRGFGLGLGRGGLGVRGFGLRLHRGAGATRKL
jgi:hypothetical protein